MAEHRITRLDLALASGLTPRTIAELRANRRLSSKRLSTLARCASALGLSIVEVFPVVGKSPRRPGLIAISMRERERRRLGAIATR